MKIDKDLIQKHFSQADYQRGLKYYRQGRVANFKTTPRENGTLVSCQVVGSDLYNVSLVVQKDRLSFQCDCPRYDEASRCKHIVAALLTYVDSKAAKGRESSSESNYAAQELLQNYMSLSGDDGTPSEQTLARLVPQLLPSSSGGYPCFSFRVGREKLYVIKDIREFLRRVFRRERYSYGKGLTLDHRLSSFDDFSQNAILLLMDQFPEICSAEEHSAFHVYWGSPEGAKNTILLRGTAFDRWFDLLRNQPVETGVKGKTFSFLDGDPKIRLTLKKQENCVELLPRVTGQYTFFGSPQSLYALGTDKLLRCSGDFRQKLAPMLRHQGNSITLSLRDMPAFCSYVLPQIQGTAAIEDPEGLLREYLPEEGTPLFYFDMEGEALRLRILIRYGERELDPFLPLEETPNTRRDLPLERRVCALAERFLLRDGSRFALADEDAIFSFLTGGMGDFQQLGEVFVTDRLREKRVQPKGANVGVSVSDGILNLEMDTGGFPPEELEALYQSLLKKRRYHRLTDGRYLALDGSPLEKIAEMAHMLQLPERALMEGKAELPAYRALYLDGMLARDGDLPARRDRQFRALVRSFKTVEESDYTLPQGLEDVLRPYQQTGFRWLKTLESYGFGGILADEMGLGKTAQVIAFFATVPREVTGLPSLVVCPASLVLNWQDELRKFAPRLKTAVIIGTAAERKRRLAESGAADVCVTSYELLRQDIGEYQKLPFYCCILDEGQHIKNRTTLVSKAVKQLNAKLRLVLTGTPIENRLSELWNLFDFLMPGYLYSHNAFVEKLEKPVVKSGDPEASRQLHRMVQPFLLRRLKQDVLKELPPKLEYVRRVALTEEERKVYHAAVHDVKSSLEQGETGKLKILAALTRLRQICCAPELCFENYHGPDSKLEACLELCAGMVENGHQILLFSQFTAMLDRLREGLTGLGITSFTLQGSTSKEKRAQLVRDFNAGGVSVFLISLKAGGTGLNLTAADVVIHYDPWWNLSAQQQATDRAHRIGQQSQVQVYKLIAQDTIEEKILKLQEKKSALMDLITGDGEGLLSMSREELLALFE
ncbi:MAG: DEAD/DEAH box helicase family protein [Angelakisella sp.]|jgi:superfamily II DNA or RNA helicase|nr:DEAD/DEAH box helicase family protein [Angelakisella sp.]